MLLDIQHIVLVIVMLIKITKEKDVVFEFVHFLALIFLFIIIAYDWGSANPPSYFLSRKKASIESFGSRLKVYLAEASIFAVAFALLSILFNDGTYVSNSGNAVWNFIGEFLITAVFVYIIDLVLTVPITELQVLRYKKRQKQIAELEAEEMQNAEELLMAATQTGETAENLNTH